MLSLEKAWAMIFPVFIFMTILLGTQFLLPAIQWDKEITEILIPRSLEVVRSLSQKLYPEK